MKYEELVAQVRNAVQNVIVSKAIGHVAFQFNIEGEAEGAFYLEMANGRVNVEPYEYYDRDMLIVTTADTIMQFVEGKLKARDAYSKGLIKAYGIINNLDILPF